MVTGTSNEILNLVRFFTKTHETSRSKSATRCHSISSATIRTTWLPSKGKTLGKGPHFEWPHA